MKASIPFLALALCWAHSAHGAVILNSFEDGLGGWDTAGDAGTFDRGGNKVAILTTAHSTLEFGSDAINVSGADPFAGGGDLEDQLGVTAGALDLDILNQVTEGSAMSRTLTVAAGDVLTFDWNLLSLDGAGFDYAFFMIDGAIISTMSSSAATSPAAGAFGNETGFSSVSHTFTQGGEVTLSFGVVDVGDYAGTSTLMLDNLAIPEPSGALLGLLGLTVLARRRR